jgi:hypothetical protein
MIPSTHINGYTYTGKVSSDRMLIHNNSMAIESSDLDMSGWKPETKQRYYDQCVDFITPRSFEEIKAGEMLIDRHISSRKRHNSKKLKNFYWHLRVMGIHTNGDFKKSNKELSAIFKVSERTITRWIATLKELNLLSYIEVEIPDHKANSAEYINEHNQIKFRYWLTNEVKSCRIIRIHFTHAITGYKNEKVGFRRDFRQIDPDFIKANVPEYKWERIPLQYRTDREQIVDMPNGNFAVVKPFLKYRSLYGFVEIGVMEEEFYDFYMNIHNHGIGPQTPKNERKPDEIDYCAIIGYSKEQRQIRFNKYLKNLKKMWPKFYEDHQEIYVPRKYTYDEEGFIEEPHDEPKEISRFGSMVISGEDWDYFKIKQQIRLGRE